MTLSKMLELLCRPHDGHPSGPVYHLVAYRGDEEVDYDGPHDNPQQVTEALRLRRRYNMQSDQARYVMVKTEPVPEQN
jgi:hypothetical protein